MLRTLSIKNYRGFRELELGGLGRINLLVGLNNSGKTSVLEAVGLLAAEGTLGMLVGAMSSRGEWLDSEGSRRPDERGLDLSYLFHGYGASYGSKIEISGTRQDASPITVELTVKDAPPRPDLRPPVRRVWRGRRDANDVEAIIGSLQVNVGSRTVQEVPIAEGWGVSFADIFESDSARAAKTAFRSVQNIPTASMDPEEVFDLVDKIQLTDEEANVLGALQMIEPRVRQFRPSRARNPAISFRGSPGRQNVILKLEGIETVLPIGTLGDGSWRMLGLALKLAAARGGVLLVDEIDTGLHFEVMAKMWQLVYETAKRLDVQVFATSHSRDCYESLATIADDSSVKTHGITIQRIEPGKSRGVLFTEQDIINAAKRGIEVR